eukprot:scaffold6152_cov99-Isochrysis_galbana.AAC.2
MPPIPMTCVAKSGTCDGGKRRTGWLTGCAGTIGDPSSAAERDGVRVSGQEEGEGGGGRQAWVLLLGSGTGQDCKHRLSGIEKNKKYRPPQLLPTPGPPSRAAAAGTPVACPSTWCAKDAPGMASGAASSAAWRGRPRRDDT